MKNALFLLGLLMCSSCSLLNKQVQDYIQKVETDAKEVVVDTEKTLDDAIHGSEANTGAQ